MGFGEAVTRTGSFIFEGLVPFLPQANPVLVLLDLAIALNVNNQVLLGGLVNRKCFSATAFYGRCAAAEQRNGDEA